MPNLCSPAQLFQLQMAIEELHNSNFTAWKKTSPPFYRGSVKMQITVDLTGHL